MFVFSIKFELFKIKISFFYLILEYTRVCFLFYDINHPFDSS